MPDADRILGGPAVQDGQFHDPGDPGSEGGLDGAQVVGRVLGAADRLGRHEKEPLCIPEGGNEACPVVEVALDDLHAGRKCNGPRPAGHRPNRCAAR